MTEGVRYISLTPDQKAVALQHLDQLRYIVADLMGWVSKDKLDPDMRVATLGLMENHQVHINQALGYDSVLAAQVEERYAMLRAANIRVRELETLLGKEQSPEAIADAIKVMQDHVRQVWDDEGFNFVSKFSVNGYGTADLVLGFSLDQTRSDSETPVTDKARRAERRQAVAARFSLLWEDDGRYSMMEDTEANRRLLQEVLTQHFPSAEITQVESYRPMDSANRPTGRYAIRYLHAHVQNLADLMPPAAPEAVAGETA